MKKLLLSLTGIAALSAIFVGVTNAQLFIYDVFSENKPMSDTSYTQVLNEYETIRWYSENDTINWEIVSNTAKITAPTVDDFELNIATSYYLFISPYRVSEIKSWNPKVDISKIIMKKVEVKSDDDQNVEFNLDSSEINPDNAYYGFVAPVDTYDWIGVPSSEICFKISSNTYNQGAWCDTFALLMSSDKNGAHSAWTEQWNKDSHDAACVWMDLANVSHVKNGNTITLKWTAVDGDKVEIAIFDPEEEIYKSLWSVDMSAEKFDYKIKWDGEQNFMITNGCKDFFYKADAAMETQKEPEKIVPAATGPAENILYIAIAAIVIYWGYVLFFRKSDN